MRQAHTAIAVACASLALLGSAWGQVAPEEQARRLLEDGRAARSQGKVKQALDSFGIIVTGFSNTSSIDDALLEIGRTQLEVSGDSEKARQSFEQVATRYPQGDAAPGAYYYLGQIALQRATNAADLDDALAQFVRLQRVYAGSQWMPRALYGAGLVHRRARRYREAVDAQRRVFLEYPSDDVAPSALFECARGLTLLGRPREAMEEYQRLRNAYPASGQAAQALDHITALYRLYASDRPTFSEDASFVLPPSQVLKDVTALLVGPGDLLWVASKSQNGVFSYTDGRPTASHAVLDPVGLVSGADATPLIVAHLGLKSGNDPLRTLSLPGDKPGVERSLERVAAALPIRDGGLLVSDLKVPGVYRFEKEGKYVGSFPDAAACEVIRMLRDDEGDLVFLDARARTIRVLDESGAPLGSIGPQGAGYSLRRPSDVAVDSARNVYVADTEEGLLVLSPEGKLLARVGETILKKPSALALAGDGTLYVYDDKLKRVIRFR
jgi:TolA-binding protein